MAAAGFSRILIGVVLSASTAFAQPRECRTEAPPSLSVKLADALPSSAQPYAGAFANYVQRVQTGGTVLPFDDGGLGARWAQYDQAMVALLIGVSANIEVLVDSASQTIGQSRRLYMTVWCVDPARRTRLGSYWLRAIGDSAQVRFRTALVDVALARPPLRIGAARVYAPVGLVLDSARIARSLGFMNAIATQLERPAPRNVDIIVAPGNDTTLSIVGIFDWSMPIAEYTSMVGPLNVVVDRDAGDVSLHELVHVATLGMPLHPLLTEGLAVYIAGARFTTLDALVCRNRPGLRSWRGANLRSLLTTGRDTTGAPADDGIEAVLGGLLAQVMIKGGRPIGMLRLTALMLNTIDGAEILKEWEAAIDRAVLACA